MEWRVEFSSFNDADGCNVVGWEFWQNQIEEHVPIEHYWCIFFCFLHLRINMSFLIATQCVWCTNSEEGQRTVSNYAQKVLEDLADVGSERVSDASSGKTLVYFPTHRPIISTWYELKCPLFWRMGVLCVVVTSVLLPTCLSHYNIKVSAYLLLFLICLWHAWCQWLEWCYFGTWGLCGPYSGNS